MAELVSHTIHGNGKLTGALAIIGVLGAMVLGPMSPFLAIALLWQGFYMSSGLLWGIIVLPFLIQFKPSTTLCRFYLQAAGWFKHGITLHLEVESIEMIDKQACIWCMHPHGTSIGLGYSLNGAIRFKAKCGTKYVPHELASRVSPERLANISGIQAPALFRIPFIRPMLHMFGCCTPATKAGLCGLLKAQQDLGVLPGGMDEVVIYKKGEERVYIRQRAGFIKYALQHGYLLVPAYTFGESDTYSTLGGSRLLDIMQQNFGVILPIFWGPHWWCPLLPDSNAQIHTVVGNAFQLPKLENPSNAEVAEYHQIYMDKLVDLYDRYKGRFGDASRPLVLY